MARLKTIVSADLPGEGFWDAGPAEGDSPESAVLRVAKLIHADLLTPEGIEKSPSRPDNDSAYDLLIAFGELAGTVSDLEGSKSKHGVLLMCTPGKTLESLDPFSRRKGDPTPVRIVTFSPVQHLYAVERLAYPRFAVELIPCPVDHRFFRPCGERNPDTVITFDLPTTDWKLLSAVLSRENVRLRIVSRRVSIPELPDAEIIPAGSAAGRRTAFCESGVVLLTLNRLHQACGLELLSEAFACGLPVVMNRSLALEHMVAHESEGLVVEASSADQLKRALNQVRGNVDLAARYGAAARRKAEDSFSLGTFANRISRICQAVARGSNQAEFFAIPCQTRLAGDETEPER
jgi:glycosyltransferase involved in cell wall biosynthesis